MIFKELFTNLNININEFFLNVNLNFSVMEKRRIMKFFNSCMEWQENDEEIRG